MQHGVEQRSGILEGYSCCLLSKGARLPGSEGQRRSGAVPGLVILEIFL